MEIVEQMRSGFSRGKKSEQSDAIPFKEWAVNWYNRKFSCDWISKLRSDTDDCPVEMNRLKWQHIRGLYRKIIARLNVLLKLKIEANGEIDLNDIESNNEMYQKMLEYLYDDKKLFWYLRPKEVELFELLLTVMDEDVYIPDSLKNDKWESIALTEREKICDILHYLVWELDWDESYFANFGLVPWESIRPNTFRIIGQPPYDYDDSFYKGRAFFDYAVRLLHPK